ncbi:CDP-archaeol synthase [Candidatus Woesearchaeota archaeon]|nr:CDP-archaeol synthase [Candidatus Woesearchaeota archaeon]
MNIAVLLVLRSLWFLLPAYVANMMPIFVRKLDFFDYPVDFNMKFMGKPLFGRSKTIRGFIFGTSGAILMAYVQYLMYANMAFFRDISILEYTRSGFLWIGVVIGLGSLLGDLIKSFFKRRIGIKPGHTWLFFDQSDYVFGAIFFSSFFFDVKILYVFIMVPLSIVLHFISVYLGYHLKLRRRMV